MDSDELAAAPPPALAPKPGQQSFDLKGTAQELFEKIAGAYGIQVEFDVAYTPSSATVTFRIADAAAGLLQAHKPPPIRSLVPLGEYLALMARDNPQKRAELMPVMAVAAPIPERLSVQEAQEISTAVQQTLESSENQLDAVKAAIRRDTGRKPGGNHSWIFAPGSLRERWSGSGT